MTEPVTNPTSALAAKGDAAARKVESTLSDVADAAGTGVQTVTTAVSGGINSWGDAIKKDGFLKGTWNYFSGLGADTAKGGANAFGKFFSGTNHGGWIGGLLGVAGAWLASNMFGGGILGMIATALLVPAGFLMGRDFGNKNINGFLSNIFGGKGRDGAAPSRTASPSKDAPTTVVATPAPAEPVINPVTGQPIVVTQAFPQGVSYSSDGPLALTSSPSDQQYGQGLVTVIAQVTDTTLGVPVTVTPVNAPVAQVPQVQSTAGVRRGA